MSLEGKDLEVYEQSKQITIDYIDELNRKNFLKKYVTSEEDVLIEKVLERVNMEGISIAKLERLLDQNKIQSLFNDVLKYEIKEIDVLNYYMALLTHQLLDIFELFKKYLLVTILKEQLGLSKNPTLGHILNQLENKGVKHRFYEIIDKDLRNALGHSWYWWQNNKFYYTVDPELKRTKELSLGELFVIVRKTSLLTTSFIDNAFKRILEITKSE